MLLGQADAFVDGIVRGYLAEALLRIHDDSCALFMDDTGAGIGLEVATTDGIEILAHAHAAMRVVANEVAAYERGGDEVGDILRRTSGGKDTPDKFDEGR